MNIIASFVICTNTFARIECIDVGNLSIGQFEVENIDVLENAIFGDRFGHWNDTELHLNSGKIKNKSLKMWNVELKGKRN